jgi:hypothetical protein
VSLTGPAGSRPRRARRPRTRHIRTLTTPTCVPGQQGIPRHRRYGPGLVLGTLGDALQRPGQNAVNRSFAKIRALAERAVATLEPGDFSVSCGAQPPASRASPKPSWPCSRCRRRRSAVRRQDLGAVSERAAGQSGLGSDGRGDRASPGDGCATDVGVEAKDGSAACSLGEPVEGGLVDAALGARGCPGYQPATSTPAAAPRWRGVMRRGVFTGAPVPGHERAPVAPGRQLRRPRSGCDD